MFYVNRISSDVNERPIFDAYFKIFLTLCPLILGTLNHDCINTNGSHIDRRVVDKRQKCIDKSPNIGLK